ncbi:MAG: hypothetical protein WCY19_08965 [Candidatus Gastranaerophilaceae bacterium]
MSNRNKIARFYVIAGGKFGKFFPPFSVSRPLIPSFTLSDVLITLGVIAVVAAMTIPALINGVQDIQYKSAYKKAFSAASQALAMANQQYLLAAATGEGDYTNHPNNFLAFKDQFKVVKECLNNNNSQCWDSTGEKTSSGYPHEETYAFIDSSGMAWSMYYGGLLQIFVDTNGFKKPNQWGKDRFGLKFKSDNGTFNSGLPIIVVPLGDGWQSVDYHGTSWLYN